MAALSRIAPVKLNMALHITGKRADGYHLLESLVVFGAVGDTLHYIPSDAALSLQVKGDFADDVGPPEQNLVWRAANLLASALEESFRGTLVLDKHVPVGAGLGGGSADAVAACRLLLHSVGRILPDVDLARILLPLGADMPMCVASKPLIARGIGEDIAQLDAFPTLHAVLCWPGVRLPTPQVYAAYRHESRFWPPLSRSYGAEVFDALASTRNVLQRPAISCAAEVAEALLALETHHTTPFVRMSGSGACCVAYFHEESAAASLAAVLQSTYPAWWVRATPIQGV